MHITTVVTFVVFLALFAIIGLASVVRKKKTTADYLLAGQDVKPWLVALAAVATCNSGFMFTGMIGITYKIGLSSLWIAIGWVFGDFIASIFSFRHIRKFSENKEIQTYSSLLSYRGGAPLKPVRLVAGIVTFVFLSIYAAAQFAASGKALLGTFDIPVWIGTIAGAVLVLGYCFAGGIRATIWSNAAQSIVMIVVMALLVGFGFEKVGGWGEAMTQWKAVSPTYLSWFSDVDSYGGLAPLLFVLGWFFAGFGTVGQPHIMVGYMTMDNGDNIGKVRAYYYSWYTAFYGATILVGMLARIILEVDGSFDAELALPKMATQLFPNFLVGVLLAGIFAATISTADSLVISCTGALTNDIFPKLKFNYIASKITTILVTAFGVGVALFSLYGETNVFDMVVYAWAVMATGFGPLLTLVLLGKKPNQIVSLVMILFGAGFTVALSKFGVPEPEYFIPGLSSGFAIYYIGTLIFPETKAVKK
ncbi:MAG TPA: sodium/proline symporter [Verrucomicrobiales bacterium]|nr:sodium/proline symporter [Verrucomicrobiales bacterium]